MSFAWPWCFLVLPLPWLVRYFFTPVESGVALRLPSLPVVQSAIRRSPIRLSQGLALFAWLLLVIAAARPQVPGSGVLQPISGRDLMVAFDLSSSMATADLLLGEEAAERLYVARYVTDKFLQRRQGDRVGLIVFGSQAYLHTPLTFDRDAVSAALASVEIGLAGHETALGDAIGLATKHLKQLPDSNRVLIVLTDGVNTAGTLNPNRATWLAQREGVRIHVVAIGTASAPDAPSTGIDEESLKGITAQTGGTYQRVTDSAAVEAFFQRLDRIEPTWHGSAITHPIAELYAWPLGLALLLVLWLMARYRQDLAL